jgi:hypothetical protein
LFAYSIQNINSSDLVLEKAQHHNILMSYHCKIMLVNFRYSRIFSIFMIPVGVIKYLGWLVGLKFLCPSTLPEVGAPGPKQV